MSFKYSRTTLSKIIRHSNQTKDEFYWCPFIHTILLEPGSCQDNDYFYNRDLFEKKLYFTEYDLQLLMEKEEIQGFDQIYYKQKSEKFFNTNEELVNLEVYDRVPKNVFTVGELIDTFEFIN